MVLLILLASGCLGGADTNPKNDPPATPSPPLPTPENPGPAPAQSGRVLLLSNFRFNACAGVEVAVLVDADAAQGLLPGNYTAKVGDTGEALIRYRIFSCAGYSINGQDSNDTVYGDASMWIEDPLLEDSADRAWYRFTIFSPEDLLGNAWQQAGYEVTTGAIVLDASTPLETLTFAGYEARYAAAGPAPTDATGLAYTDTALGTIVWRDAVTTAAPSERGIGTVSVPAGAAMALLMPTDPSKVNITIHRQSDIGVPTIFRYQ